MEGGATWLKRGGCGLAVLVTCALFGAPAQAASTITVTKNSADTYSQTDTDCSLRDAVQAADADTAFGACPAGSAAGTTIVVPAGTYTLSIPSTGIDDNSTGDLNITQSVTLEGAGLGKTTIDSNHIDRIFNIASGTTVTITGVTLTNGTAPAGAAGSSAPSQGGPGADGGAILNAGTLTLGDDVIEDSVAGRGGAGGGNSSSHSNAPGGAGGNGGAVSSSAPITLQQGVSFPDDTAGAGGNGGSAGGFPAAGGGNGGSGGAIYTTAQLSVTGASFSNDAAGGSTGTSAGSGGAISASAGLSISRSTFVDDSAGTGSGGIVSSSGGSGGAISTSGTTTVLSSSLTGNATGASSFSGLGSLVPKSSGAGGAIYANGALTLTGDTFTADSTAPGFNATFGGPSGAGGAVDALGTLAVAQSTFAGNSTGDAGTTTGGSGATSASGGAGGAISASQGASVSASTFDSNATGAGGNDAASTAGNGGAGGAISARGVLTLTDSTFTGNTVGTGGSGMTNGTPGDGAAIWLNGTSGSSLVNDTLTGNGDTGGASSAVAIFTGTTTATVEAVTDAQNGARAIVQNGSAVVSLADSLLAQNVPANCGGTVTDAGSNLSFPATDSSCPSTFVHGEPRLASSLAANGGTTPTLALQPGSAAIDAGPATSGSSCPTTDQRGMPRPQGKACDIGAFESSTPVITIAVPSSGAKYKQGQLVKAAYKCTEGGMRKFIASCTGTVASGSPISTSAPGPHSFTVTATDFSGFSTTKTVSYTVTRVPPPNTVLTGHVVGKHTAQFSFRGTGGVGRLHFKCRLDTAAFTACSSPKAYAGLKAASHHTFEVEAIDSRGIADPTPAKLSFTLKH